VRHRFHRLRHIHYSRPRPRNKKHSKLNPPQVSTSTIGFLQIQVPVKILRHLLPRASRAPLSHKMHHHIYEPIIRIHLRSARRREVIIQPQLLQLRRRHPLNNMCRVHHETESRPIATTEEGDTHARAVTGRQRGAMRDSQSVGSAAANICKSMVVRGKVVARIGKRVAHPQARRGTRHKCGCLALDLKLANLASRQDRK
jgi:hypothetical protein